MFEELALSLSTAIFFICTLMVSAVIPSSPLETSSVCETVSESAVTAASAIPSDSFLLTGVWNNSGRSFEFTKQGKILFDNNSADYSYDGENITVTALIDGNERSYTFKLEILSPRVMKIGEVLFYKIGQAAA